MENQNTTRQTLTPIREQVADVSASALSQQIHALGSAAALLDCRLRRAQAQRAAQIALYGACPRCGTAYDNDADPCPKCQDDDGRDGYDVEGAGV
ncbi:MAG: hypothetical protein M3Q55_02675 [Acidobacteriota bacterium]|nr:hypothetical protein [Acidobacteriota bacterium]